ncbi:MAG: D-2-hydroxyacid dehydrogenase [Pirellulaceae bacterium]
MPADSLKLITCYPLSDGCADRIRQSYPQLELVVCDQDTIADQLAAADIFCGHAKVPVDWQAVVDAGNLRWIQSSAAGLDHCLTPPVIQSEIRVSSCSGVFRDSVAEQTLALLYGLMRGLPVFFQQQRQRQYVRRPTNDLHHQRIGIVGFGGNGQRIAEMLMPLGTPIIATDRLSTQWQASGPLPAIDELWPAERLDDLLAQSDVVVLTIPLDESTDRIIGSRELGQMPRGSWLINVGRGRLVDEDALVDALTSGQLAGAGLDVAFEEPLPPTSRLWELSNVIITPHVGAQSRYRNDLVTDLLIENVQRFLNGATLKNEVDKSQGIPLPDARR